MPSFVESLNAAGLIFTPYDRATGWPKALDLERLAILQCPDKIGFQEALFSNLKEECKLQTISSSAAMRWAGLYFSQRPIPFDKCLETPEREITAQVFSDWLQQADIQPSIYITAWFIACGILEPPAPPVVQAKAKRCSWWDVASPYMVRIMQEGQYATAKELYNELETKAGSSNSPFDKGTGKNRFALFIRDLATSLTMKTVQNNWKKLLNAAAQK